MSVPASVAVNPQSATDATSGAGGGVGAHTFVVGTNPNLSVLGIGVGGLPPWLLIAGAALVAFLLLRRR